MFRGCHNKVTQERLLLSVYEACEFYLQKVSTSAFTANKQFDFT